MPGKMARSTPRPRFGPLKVPPAVCTSRGLAGRPEKREYSRHITGHAGNPSLESRAVMRTIRKRTDLGRALLYGATGITMISVSTALADDKPKGTYALVGTQICLISPGGFKDDGHGN